MSIQHTIRRAAAAAGVAAILALGVAAPASAEVVNQPLGGRGGLVPGGRPAPVVTHDCQISDADGTVLTVVADGTSQVVQSLYGDNHVVSCSDGSATITPLAAPVNPANNPNA